jgi:hypothetical protein
MPNPQTGPRWLMQIKPTAKGLAAHPHWRDMPRQIPIWDRDERDRRIKAARDAMHRGEIHAFRCDPV